MQAGRYQRQGSEAIDLSPQFVERQAEPVEFLQG